MRVAELRAGRGESVRPALRQLAAPILVPRTMTFRQSARSQAAGRSQSKTEEGGAGCHMSFQWRTLGGGSGIRATKHCIDGAVVRLDSQPNDSVKHRSLIRTLARRSI